MIPVTTTHRTITIDRAYGPLVCDIWEPAHPSSNPPVLLVHGWGGTGNYWHPTAEQLAENVMVIVPDLPGTGRSQPVRKAQNMFDQVEALHLLLDELGVDEVQVVGHSMGGAMTLLLADSRPEQVERIVLTSLSFFKNAAQERIYKAIMRVFKVTMAYRPSWLASVPGVPEIMATRYFHNVPDDHELLRRGLLDYLQLDAATAAACADDAPNPAITATGEHIRVPVLMIACRQDKVMPPENVEFTADIIPDCTVHWIDQCGHMPMIEKPDEYMALLRNFLRL